MYGLRPIVTAIALPTGGMADVPGVILRFNVEEEEMLAEVGFKGTIANANAAAQTADLNLQVDGVNATALPLASANLIATTGRETLEASVVLRLTKGQHVLKLQANASVAADVTIAGTVYDCRLYVERRSADAVLAHGEDSKVQGIY